MLASNENPLGPCPAARRAAAEALIGLSAYPIDGAPALREALSQQLGCSNAELVVTSGSTEAIQLLGRAMEGEVLIAQGSFPLYERAALASGRPLRALPRRAHLVDLEAMAAAVHSQTGLLFLARPDNPTGSSAPLEALEAFLRRLPAHVTVVIDEAYAEYAGEERSALRLRDAHPRLIVLRTFSKAHGLAALRIGYAIGPADIIEQLDRLRDPFNVSAPAQAAAMEALRDAAWLEQGLAQNRRARALLAQGLAERGLPALPSEACFLFLPDQQVATAEGPRPLHDLLRESGITTRDMAPWGHPGALRISVGSEAEGEAVLACIDTVSGPGAQRRAA
jgi:histidinol-phosphate aminotransferase